MKPLALALFIFCLQCTSVTQAEAYKCRLPDGRIEFSDRGCAGGSTLVVRPDEKISPERQAQAERDLERMRRYIEERETAQQRELAERQAREGNTSSLLEKPSGPSSQAIENCLKEIDRLALNNLQRQQFEASCRSTATPPILTESAPQPQTNTAMNRCLQQVQALNLSAAEKQQRIALCQGVPVAASPPAKNKAGNISNRSNSYSTPVCSPGKWCSQ